MITNRPQRLITSVSSLALAATLALSGCAAQTDTATGTTTSGSTSSTAAVVATTYDTATASTDATTTAETIAATTEALDAFLATLGEEEREAVLYDYDDATKSTAWSNFPLSFVERNGLTLSELTEEQQAAAMAVLEALLSDSGFQTVTDIMNGDVYLLENSSSTEETLGQYTIAIYGDPTSDGQYSIQVGGHHLGFNADLDTENDDITFAPTHLGSQPYSYTAADGTEVVTMGTFYETAFAFYDSLDAEQQTALYQGETVQNLTCAPGDTCDFPTGTGVSGSELTDEQRELLLDVIANWVGLADQETTDEALATIEATLDDTFVSWAGATTYDTTQGEGISFTISGPDVYIEFSSQQGSAGADIDGLSTSGWGHVHSIYRDPTDDYAGSVTQGEASAPGGGQGGGPGGGTPPTS